MKHLAKLISTFIIAGTTVSGISYVANNLNPLAAGIISGVPISIPSMALIDNRNNQKQFILSAVITVAYLTLITGICAILMHKTNLSYIICIIISMLIWCIGAFIYYIYISKNVK